MKRNYLLWVFPILLIVVLLPHSSSAEEEITQQHVEELQRLIEETEGDQNWHGQDLGNLVQVGFIGNVYRDYYHSYVKVYERGTILTTFTLSPYTNHTHVSKVGDSLLAKRAQYGTQEAEVQDIPEVQKWAEGITSFTPANGKGAMYQQTVWSTGPENLVGKTYGTIFEEWILQWTANRIFVPTWFGK